MSRWLCSVIHPESKNIKLKHFEELNMECSLKVRTIIDQRRNNYMDALFSALIPLLFSRVNVTFRLLWKFSTQSNQLPCKFWFQPVLHHFKTDVSISDMSERLLKKQVMLQAVTLVRLSRIYGSFMRDIKLFGLKLKCVTVYNVIFN